MRWLVQENAKEWLFDLSDVLLFPHLPIHNVQYSIEIESEDAFARHASRPPQGMVRPLVLSLLLLSLWHRRFTAAAGRAGGAGGDGRGGHGDGHDHGGPIAAQRGVLAEQDLPVPVGRGLPLLLASGRGVPVYVAQSQGEWNGRLCNARPGQPLTAQPTIIDALRYSYMYS